MLTSSLLSSTEWRSKGDERISSGMGEGWEMGVSRGKPPCYTAKGHPRRDHCNLLNSCLKVGEGGEGQENERKP